MAEVIGSLDDSGNPVLSTLKTNIISNIPGATHNDAASFPLTVTYTATNNSYTVTSSGIVTANNSSSEGVTATTNQSINRNQGGNIYG